MNRKMGSVVNSANAARVASIKAEQSRDERRRRAAPAMLAALREVLRDSGAASLSTSTMKVIIAAVKEAE